jgi:hypothetical protein
MAEILTESFCERCGSRYTFESAVPRARLRGVKVLSRGLKNFVLDDKTSIDEAMAAARDDTDRSLTSQQLEAFHKTFNFCMQCRQYICPNCWNEGEGRCLTCAPTLGRGILPSPFPNLDPMAGIGAAPEDGLAAAAMNGHTNAAHTTNGNGFDAAADALSQATMPTELIGASEIEAQGAAEPVAVAPESVEPSVDVAAASDAETAASAIDAAAVASVPERVLYDPYDPPPSAPPVTSQPETIAAAVAPEPEVVEGAAVAPIEETLAAQDIIEADAVTPGDEVVTGSDGAPAAEISLSLAGLQPGQSLDEALAAFEAEPVADETTTPDVPDVVVAPEAPVAAEVVVEPESQSPVVLGAEAPVVVDTPVEAVSEPVAAVEPLDDILDVRPEAAPEPAWQAEPLDDIVPVDAAAAESVVEAEPTTPESDTLEPAAIEAVPEPSTQPEPGSSEAPAAAAADDVVAQPTWSILAPEARPVTEVPGPLVDVPAVEPAAPVAQAAPPESAEPNWPAQPQWPSPRPSAGLPFLGRPVVPTGGVDALWAESNQAVSAPRTGTGKPAGGVQPCTSCGLSLSASARFCRRCGTSQAG